MQKGKFYYDGSVSLPTSNSFEVVSRGYNAPDLPLNKGLNNNGNFNAAKGAARPKKSVSKLSKLITPRKTRDANDTGYVLAFLNYSHKGENISVKNSYRNRNEIFTEISKSIKE